MDTFSERLKYARKRSRFTQAKLGKKTDMYPSYISKFEAGQSKPHFDKIAPLAIALNVETDFLLGICPYLNRQERSTPQRHLEALRKIADDREEASVSILRAIAREALKPISRHKQCQQPQIVTIKPNSN